jgi:FAD/FMN-containing dehydrogenase
MADAVFLEETPRLNRLVHDIVASLGGSISAEHGIGRLRRTELPAYKSAVAMALMRSLKATLDPNGIMNPGVLL